MSLGGFGGSGNLNKYILGSFNLNLYANCIIKAGVKILGSYGYNLSVGGLEEVRSVDGVADRLDNIIEVGLRRLMTSAAPFPNLERYRLRAFKGALMKRNDLKFNWP